MFIVSLVLFQVFIFIGLIFMLRRIMVRNIASATTHLDSLSQDYAKRDEELHKQMEEAAQKSQEILQSAHDEAERIKIEAAKEAGEEKERVVAQGRKQASDIVEQADKSCHVLLAEINEKVAQQAVDKACELIEQTLPKEFKEKVHLYWAEELIENGFSSIERLRVPKDIKEIRVVSAFALSQEERKSLSKKIKEVLGYDAALKEEVDQKIVAGIIVIMGSLVLDGSLKSRIQENIRNGG